MNQKHFIKSRNFAWRKIGPKNSAMAMMLLLFLSFASQYLAAAPTTLNIHYLQLEVAKPALLSNLLAPPSDSGLAGTHLAIADANTTGKFVNQHFTLSSFKSPAQDKLLENIEQKYRQGTYFFVVDVDVKTLIELNRWASDKAALIFNIANKENSLRHTQCLASVFHTAASDAMKSDALAQWLLYRRFNRVLVIQGQYPRDIAMVKAFNRSAKRFGIKIIDVKTWSFNADLRRSASQEMPLFTQSASDYDVVYVADEQKDFAQYLPYNTYLPRPVIGSAGLEALGWHWSIEQWGAAQLQNRFKRLTQRLMNETDFSGYLAIQSIAQAALKSDISGPESIVRYLHSERLELAAYVGRKLSFRRWNRQLRMPIALVQPNALISQSPQPGVLHPINELDTLGYDQAETKCSDKKG